MQIKCFSIDLRPLCQFFDGTSIRLLSIVFVCVFLFNGCVRSENAVNTSGTIPSHEKVSNEPLYDYQTEELYAQREDNRIYGVIYIPQDAGERMLAVIYSHGFGGSYHYGISYAEALAARGYVVYCFDFCGGSPGSQSDGSQYEMSIFTEQKDLEAVIAMMQGLEYVDDNNIFLLGSSQGGVVSAMTAADHRDEIAGLNL